MQLDGGKLIPSPVHLSVNENTVEKNCLGSTEGGREKRRKSIYNWANKNIMFKHQIGIKCFCFQLKGKFFSDFESESRKAFAVKEIWERKKQKLFSVIKYEV